MNAKKIVTILLALFAAAGIVYAVIGGGTAATEPDSKDPAAGTKKEAALPDGLSVYYFHTTVRCYSCNLIERLTKETVRENFADDLKSGAVRWQEANYEQPSFAPFKERYNLYTKQVILSAVKGGKEAAWRDLDEVWALKGDEMRFKLYVSEEIKKFRAEHGL
jgi:hypothetical protein